MANKFKGEVSAKVNGEDYTFVMNFNALVEFEEITGANALDVLHEAEKTKKPLSAKQTVALVFAALRKHHPDVSFEEAGELVSEDLQLPQKIILACAPRGNAKARKPSKVTAQKTAD